MPYKPNSDFEPKREDLFTVIFPLETKLSDKHIISIDGPNYKNNEWSPIKIVFADSIAPSNTRQLYDFIDYLHLSKNNNDKVLFKFFLQSLDPTGCPVQEWIIEVEKVLEVNFGSFNVNNDKILNNFIIVKPLHCHLHY